MDMGQIMRQAQEFRQKIAELQDDAARKTVSATVGGGMVTATVNGRLELVGLEIDPVAIDPREPTMLRDLVQAAVNEAMRKAKEMLGDETRRLMGGINLPIPGLFG